MELEMKYIEILQQYNIPYKTEGHHHCRQGWIQTDCPFCGKNTHKWHLGYNISNKYCTCWRCGWHPLIKVIAELTGLSFRKSVKLIDDIPATSVPEIKQKTGKLTLPSNIGKLQLPHKRYLKQRGFDWKRLIKQWEIKGIGISAKLNWHIFIPISFRGELVSWTTRTIGNNKAKYNSAPVECESINHKTILYGEDYATNSIIITEGPLDVWKIGPGAVATFGMSYTTSQVERMTRFPRRYVCFDNEKLAQQKAKQLCDLLSIFDGETYNITLDSKDPGEAKPKEIKQLRKLLE